ncbi:MAG: S-adenosyl-l-methionine hydroxide adenosyltransferase family protein [Candidatus Aminicenantes bacterium]
MKTPVIALMTDFGEQDFFVPSLKGIILSINPAVRLVDITHRLPSFDIHSAGFILLSCYRYFPKNTIFLAVVDPGVGSARKILLAQTGKYYFIAPDNGLLGLVLEEEDHQVREVRNEKFFLHPHSQTFEARDKMAPAASFLSAGVSCQEFGPELHRFQKSKFKKPVQKKNEIIGHVLYRDKFGNLITNIPSEMVRSFQGQSKNRHLSVMVKKKEISGFAKSYSAVKKGDILFLEGSVGLIELAAREDSAARKLKVGPGQEVKIRLKK